MAFLLLNTFEDVSWLDPAVFENKSQEGPFLAFITNVLASFFLENDAHEQHFDVTVAIVVAVAVQQISYCMVWQCGDVEPEGRTMQ